MNKVTSRVRQAEILILSMVLGGSFLANPSQTSRAFSKFSTVSKTSIVQSATPAMWEALSETPARTTYRKKLYQILYPTK
jgi:hypothetical protein